MLNALRNSPRLGAISLGVVIAAIAATTFATHIFRDDQTTVSRIRDSSKIVVRFKHAKPADAVPVISALLPAPQIVVNENANSLTFDANFTENSNPDPAVKERLRAVLRIIIALDTPVGSTIHLDAAADELQIAPSDLAPAVEVKHHNDSPATAPEFSSFDAPHPLP